MRRALAAALLALAAGAGAGAAAPPVERVGFAPADGAVLPLDARFVDEHDRAVRLGDLLASRPALVVPAYYGCANLCATVLQGVAAALGRSGLRAGYDLDVVVVSIDPLDSPASARAKARAVVASNAAGWHFLSGREDAIDRFTGALGYRYAYDAAGAQYAHAAGVAVVAPGGRIERVLYGVAFPPAELRGALHGAGAGVRASDEGPAASTWLLCFRYNPRTGRYSLAAMTTVRIAALAALAALLGFALHALRREGGRR